MPIGLITHWVFVVLGVIAFVIEVRALVDAGLRPARSYLSAEKRTKVFWVALTGVATFVGYLAIPPFVLGGIRIGFGLPLLFGLVAVLPAAIYLADVKPEVSRYSGGKGRPDGRW